MTNSNSSLNYNNIAELFVEFFNNRKFSKDEEDQLFDDINKNEWWMAGDESKFKFAGTKLIKDRFESQFPVVCGFDEWYFKPTDIIIDPKNNKIMLEIDCKGIGYGDKVYTNNYLFILSINKNGKINCIREYLDVNSVANFSLNSSFIVKQFNKLNH